MQTCQIFILFKRRNLNDQTVVTKKYEPGSCLDLEFLPRNGNISENFRSDDFMQKKGLETSIGNWFGRNCFLWFYHSLLLSVQKNSAFICLCMLQRVKTWRLQTPWILKGKDFFDFFSAESINQYITLIKRFNDDNKII